MAKTNETGNMLKVVFNWGLSIMVPATPEFLDAINLLTGEKVRFGDDYYVSDPATDAGLTFWRERPEQRENIRVTMVSAHEWKKLQDAAPRGEAILADREKVDA